MEYKDWFKIFIDQAYKYLEQIPDEELRRNTEDIVDLRGDENVRNRE
jgi:hypothetical protein